MKTTLIIITNWVILVLVVVVAVAVSYIYTWVTSLFGSNYMLPCNAQGKAKHKTPVSLCA